MKTDQKRSVGRPRLHPDGLTERLCVPVSAEEYRRLDQISKLRDVSKATIARERLFRKNY